MFLRPAALSSDVVAEEVPPPPKDTTTLLPNRHVHTTGNSSTEFLESCCRSSVSRFRRSLPRKSFLKSSRFVCVEEDYNISLGLPIVFFLRAALFYICFIALFLFKLRALRIGVGRYSSPFSSWGT